MSDVSILIIEDNRDFAYLLKLLIADIPGCRVAGTVEDGANALEAVRRTSPDVVLLDIALPAVDGLEILKSINNIPRAPLVFVMSVIRSRQILEEATALGAAHYFIKPIDIDALTRIIRLAFGDSLPAAERVTKLLHAHRIPPDIKGFRYLRDIIIDTINQSTPDFGALVCRIAERDGVSAEAVRRAVRYAISVAWDRDNGDDPQSLFFAMKRNREGRPDIRRFARDAAQKARG